MIATFAATAALTLWTPVPHTAPALMGQCHTTGHAPFTAPDNACTPGRADQLTRSEVCTPKDRPSIPAAVRREVLRRYGVTRWTGVMGEIDHRIPVFLGGRTDVAQLWPEAGPIPNLKDRLEALVYRRVCTGRPHPMRVRTAVRLFLVDWRLSYARYIGPVG